MDEKNEVKKYENHKRASGEYCQVFVQLPIEMNEKLVEYAKKEHSTKAAWLTDILTQVIENDGKVTKNGASMEIVNAKLDEILQVSNADDIKSIHQKLDTLINLVSKLLL